MKRGRGLYFPVGGSMLKHIFGIVILGIAAAVFSYTAFRHTFATVNDKVYGLANAVVCVVLFLTATVGGAIAALKRRPTIRNYFAAIALAAGFVAAIPFVGTAYRLGATKQYLAEMYAVLAANGPPFPSELPTPMRADTNVLISHGYWVSEDKQTFEVYYHDGSDSFTMVYPNGQWESRGNKYAGPKTKRD